MTDLVPAGLEGMGVESAGQSAANFVKGQENGEKESDRT